MEDLLKSCYFFEHLNSLYGYNNVCSNADEVINFKPPIGLSAKVLRCLTPYFTTSCDMLASSDRSVEVAVCSEPIFERHFLQPDDYCNSIPQKCALDNFKKFKAHLFYGCLSENSKLDLMYSCFLTPNNFLNISGASYLNWSSKNTASSFFGAQTTLISKWKKFRSYLTYSTRQQTIGASFLSTLKGTKNLSVGGEVFFSASDFTGTVSMGLKYVNRTNIAKYDDSRQDDTFSILMNPIFGQLVTTFTCHPVPSAFSCVRYNLNIYSYDADIGIGFDYTPTHNKKKNEMLGQLSKAKLRLGREIALSFIYYPRERLKMEFGFFINPKNPSLDRFGVGIQLY